MTAAITNNARAAKNDSYSIKTKTQTASASRLTVNELGTFQNRREAGATIAIRSSARLMKATRGAGITE